MTDDDETLIILAIKRGGRSINTFIRGTHTDADESVYAPSWVCQALGVEVGEPVELERALPGIGSTITIKPHTSAYSLLEDPVSELRNAFENYSCLSDGIDIPLMVAGELLIVSIIDVGSVGPICIRGLELEVKIETPLDKEAEERGAEAAAAIAEETAEAMAEAVRALAKAEEVAAANKFIHDEAARKAAEIDKKRFPGLGRRLDGKNSN